MTEAYIIDAVRTPRGIGKVGKGALADQHPQHLAATVLKAIAERKVGDRVELKWEIKEEHKRIVSMRLAPAASQPGTGTGGSAASQPDRGTAVGAVSEKGDTWIRVKTDTDNERYSITPCDDTRS